MFHLNRISNESMVSTPFIQIFITNWYTVQILVCNAKLRKIVKILKTWQNESTMYNNLDNDSYGYKGEMFNYYK